MKKLFTGVILFALFIGFTGTTLAADGSAIFKAKCLACHGPDGKGTVMAPAFKGNAYINDSTAEEITATIKDGRNGAAKKYKNFALGMPPQHLNDDELSAVVSYLKSLASESAE